MIDVLLVTVLFWFGENTLKSMLKTYLNKGITKMTQYIFVCIGYKNLKRQTCIKMWYKVKINT